VPGQPKKQAKAGPDLDKSLLDAAVRTLFEMSWGRARELIQRGKITVDGKTLTSATTRIRAGAEIVLDLEAKKQRDPNDLSAEALVFVDGHVAVIEKPSGISTVPYEPEGMGASIAKRSTRPGDEVTLVERVKTLLGRREKRPGPPPDVGVVHRLDKETSGLIVFTRTWAAKKELTQAFRVHAVHRRYIALVHGRPPKSKTIESSLIENRGDGLRGSIEKRHGRKHAVGSERSQRAVTHIELIEQFKDVALVACRLETGRTHQIRIHLAEEGLPLLGERVYIRDFKGTPIPSPRIMLHAAELGFDHPATQEAMRWTSEPPPDMQEMIKYARG